MSTEGEHCHWGIFEIPWKNLQGDKYISVVVARTQKEAASVLHGLIGGKEKLDTGEIQVSGSNIKKLRTDYSYAVGTYRVGRAFDETKAHLIADHIEGEL
jgi:hypothetical protein